MSTRTVPRPGVAAWTVAGLVSSLATLAAASAQAEDYSYWIWAKGPQRAEVINAYPAAAASAGLAGSAKLRCSVDATGALRDCTVAEETPAGKGFGAAALSLAPPIRLDLKGADGQPIAGRNVLVPFSFDPAALRGGAVQTPPQWLRRPSADEMAKYIPASGRGVKGHATIECAITLRGTLDQCVVREETPADHGFGAAAVGLAGLFIMRPMTRDGLPVGGARVTVPIGFESFTTSAANVGSIRVLQRAPWSATPTLAGMTAAFPKAAIGRVASARVVLRCDLQPDGRLAACDTVQESPPHQGFGQAAHSVATQFRAVMTGIDEKWSTVKIDVPFDFRDPSVAAPPVEIYEPIWRAGGQNPVATTQPFPEAAAKAGVKEGQVSLDCLAVHDGSLATCTVASETPAGLGFGAAALKEAEHMSLNPWTSDGTPVDGAHVKVPIHMVAPGGAPTPAKP